MPASLCPQAFLNLHAYTYVRLDGATKPEQRQILMQRFNSDPKIFCFILSTRRHVSFCLPELHIGCMSGLAISWACTNSGRFTLASTN